MYNFVRAFREPASDFDFECTQVVTLGVTDQIKSSCLNDFDEKKDPWGSAASFSLSALFQQNF